MSRPVQRPASNSDARKRQAAREPVYGQCLHCGTLEVALVRPVGTTNYSDIGESDTYPTGYGCEVCS